MLTDGTVLVHGNGSESKKFGIRDGIAMVWAQRVGLKVGFLSARTSATTPQRAAQLGITLVYQGVPSKADAFARIIEAERIAAADVAYMGDDIVDLAGTRTGRIVGRPGRRGRRSSPARGLGQRGTWRTRRCARAD